MHYCGLLICVKIDLFQKVLNTCIISWFQLKAHGLFQLWPVGVQSVYKGYLSR